MRKLLTLLITLSALLFPMASHADEPLSVSATPVFSLLTINPGATTTQAITLTNSSKTALNISVESHGFAATDDSGGSDFPDSKSGPQHWFSFSPSTFTLEAQSKKQVIATISVPKDAVSGGQYASVFFVASAASDNGEPTTKVNFSARIGTFFFMTIGGNLHPQGQVSRFSTKMFWQHSPVLFNVSVHNFGNIHIKPHSTLTIKNIFGKTVYQAVDPGLFVLPGKTRNWEVPSNKHLSPGLYTATLATKITQKSHETVRTIHFWILPWQLILLILIVGFFGVLVLKPQLRRLKKDFSDAGGMPMVKSVAKRRSKALARTARMIYHRAITKFTKRK